MLPLPQYETKEMVCYADLAFKYDKLAKEYGRKGQAACIRVWMEACVDAGFSAASQPEKLYGLIEKYKKMHHQSWTEYYPHLAAADLALEDHLLWSQVDSSGGGGEHSQSSGTGPIQLTYGQRLELAMGGELAPPSPTYRPSDPSYSPTSPSYSPVQPTWPPQLGGLELPPPLVRDGPPIVLEEKRDYGDCEVEILDHKSPDDICADGRRKGLRGKTKKKKKPDLRHEQKVRVNLSMAGRQKQSLGRKRAHWFKAKAVARKAKAERMARARGRPILL